MNPPSHKLSRPPGYGLLLLILIILGVSLTATVTIISSKSLKDRNSVAETQAKLKAIAFAISGTHLSGSLAQRHYEADVGALPAALSDLITRPGGVPACSYDTATQSLKNWCGPYWVATYQGEIPFMDSWANPITFDAAGRRIYSQGPNRTDDGGAGDDIVQVF